MTAIPTEHHLSHAPEAAGRSFETTTEDPAVLLLYGEECANLALADELALDGYKVRRASDPAMLRAACDTGEVELVIFGRATRRGAGLDVLRRLRAGAFAPEVKPGLRALWMSMIVERWASAIFLLPSADCLSVAALLSTKRS